MALKRFIARRGRPQSIHSDNGTDFVGANNELRESIKLLDEERIQNFCTPKEIELKFQPPSVPHFEGAWERLLQCTKTTLKAIVADRIVSKDVPRTALVKAEGILNSRPTTQVSNDSGDIEALTPNHFLLLQANPSYGDADVSDREMEIKDGDVVLVAEPNQPRGVWPLGRMVSTHPGQDGSV